MSNTTGVRYCSFQSMKEITIMRTQTSHYNDVIMSSRASQFTGVSIVCSTVCSGADQRKHQSSVSLAFVRGIHRWPVNSPHKGPVTRTMFPFDDVIVIMRPSSSLIITYSVCTQVQGQRSCWAGCQGRASRELVSVIIDWVYQSGLWNA